VEKDEVERTKDEASPESATRTEAAAQTAGACYPGLEPEPGQDAGQAKPMPGPEPVPKGMVWIGRGVGTQVPVMDEEMLEVLGRIRAARKPNPLYGKSPGLCDRCLKQITDPLLCGAGLGMAILNEYRWFVRELSRILRNDPGPELAQHLELAVLKWNNYGLEPHTMQFLICEVFKRFRKMQSPEKLLHDLPEDEQPAKEVHRARKAPADTG